MAKTTVRAPRTIPQDLQREIIVLAVLKTRLDRITAACDEKKEQIARMLVAGVEVR